MSELGNKHECLGCGTKFYDLGRSELICPSCGENQKDLAAAQEGAENEPKPAKKKKKKAPAKKKAAAKAKAEKQASAAADPDTSEKTDSADEESQDEEK